LRDFGKDGSFIVKFYGAMLTIEEIPILGHIVYGIRWFFEKIFSIDWIDYAPSIPVPEIALD